MSWDKNLPKPYMTRILDSTSDRAMLTGTWQMDSFFNSAMSVSIPNPCPAYCLSGINTGDNTGAGNEPNDAYRDPLGYVWITVWPEPDHIAKPADPRSFKDPAQIIESIRVIQAAGYWVRSDYLAHGARIPSFGEKINIYFENPPTNRADFSNGRFSQPMDVPDYGKQLKPFPFRNLASIEGLSSAQAAFDGTAASLLGATTIGVNADQATAQGKSANIKGDRKGPVEYVVIHYSAANGGKEAVLKYENKSTEYGYHFMVDRNGSFFTTAEPEQIVWHAGGNKTVKNSNSVGLCIMNTGYERDGVPAKANWVEGKYPNSSKTGKWEPYTEASLKRSAELLAPVLKKYNLTVDKIVGHSDIQINKSDPGPAFDMAAFRQRVKRLI